MDMDTADDPELDHQIIINLNNDNRISNDHEDAQVTFTSRVLSLINTVRDIQAYTPAFVSNALEKIVDFLFTICPLSPLPSGYDERHVDRVINSTLCRIEGSPVDAEFRRRNSIRFVSQPPRRESDVLGDVLDEAKTSPKDIRNEPETKRKSSKATDASHCSVKRIPGYQEALSIEKSATIAQELQRVFEWNFDVIQLERLSNKRPLTTSGMEIFPAFNTHNILKIDLDILNNWLVLIEANYHYRNPYHNATHAADVVQASAYFLRTACLTNLLEPLDHVIALLAAAVHDIDHPGKTNAYLVNTKHELAILYNDKSVLETHHAAFAFKLTMSDPRVNIFQNIDEEMFQKIRGSLIDMILATEMINNTTHVQNFHSAWKQFMSTSSYGADELNMDDFKSEENIIFTKRLLIKCADVSNPARPVRVSAAWVLRVCEEFFQQDEDEKQNGLPLTLPSFDRETCSVTAAQLGFNDFFVRDLFALWNEFLNIPQVMNNLKVNYNFWKKMECKKIIHIDEIQQYFTISKIAGPSVYNIA